MAKHQQPNSHQARHVVSGKIVDAAGKAVQGLNVRAYERRLRAERELGHAITDADGQYRIAYQVPEPGRSGRQGLDLLVKVFRGRDPEPILVSPVAFHAGETHRIDLTLLAPEVPHRSEYETLLETLEPALAGVDPADLGDEDVEFLAGSTRAGPHRISLLRQAARAAVATGIASEVWYALARQGVAIDSPARLAERRLPAVRRALESAVAERVLPERYRDGLDALMDELRTRAIAEVLRPEVRSDRLPIGALLATSRLSPAARERLVAVAMEEEGARQDFWQRVAKTPEFADRGQLEEAFVALQLGLLTGFHLPLVQALQSMRVDGRLTGLRDLARWDEPQWLALVRETGIPGHVPGEAEEARAQTYATALFREVESALPTATIAAQLNRSALPERKELGAFFAEHPDFDLLTDSVERRFGSALTPSVRDGVKRIQRLARITPRFRQVEALMGAGFTSAQKIGAMSEGAFVAHMGAALGSEQECRAVYRRAARRKDLALNLRIRHGAEQDLYRFRAIPPASPATMESAVPALAGSETGSTPGAGTESQPGLTTPVDISGTVLDATAPQAPERPIDWTALFGSPDVCACRHCRSVLSPAAYFVDLLQFLKHETDNGIGLATLLAPDRRPDLQHILLTCENTDTPLPYVDLVNEVLESAVAGETEVEPHQTTWSQDELAANPEHVTQRAYDRLREAIFPLTLPLDLDAEEVRVYLRHLGVARHALLETFHPGADPLDAPEIAAEYLGLTGREWRLIEGDETKPWDLWGLQESNWLEALSRPRELMRRAGVTFAELAELLSLGFVNRLNVVEITFGATGASPGPAGPGQQDPSEDCQLDHARLNVETDPQALSRLCRFVRLRRKLDWSMRDLDVALLALAGGHTGSSIPLLAVSHLKRLQERLGLPIPTLAVFFGPLSTRPGAGGGPSQSEPSQYERTFLARSGVHPDQDEQRKAFLVENLGAGSSLREVLPYAAGALGTPADQLLVLVDWLEGLGRRALTVDLPSLSMLYRLTRLARALRLRARELRALIELHGVGPAAPGANPLAPFVPAEVSALLDGGDRLEAAGFSVEELDYLLRHRFAVPAKAEDSLRQRAVILEDLRNGLRKIAQETPVPPAGSGGSEASASDARGEQLRHTLGRLLERDQVEAAMRWARGEISLTSKPAQALLDALTDPRAGPLHLDLEAAERRFAGTPDLTASARAIKEQGNYGYLLRLAAPLLRRFLSQSFVKQQLAVALSLDEMLAERLLGDWVLAAGPDPARKAIEVFLEPSFVEAETPLVVESYAEQQAKEREFNTQFQTLLRLQKVAAVLARLRIDAHQATYLFSDTERGWLDPRELPLESVSADDLSRARALYTGWQRLVDLCGLRDRIGPAEPALFDLFELAGQRARGGAPEALDRFLSTLAERMRWSPKDLEALRARFGYDQASAQDAFLDERAYLRIERCFRVAHRIGVAISEPESESPSEGATTLPNILDWLRLSSPSPVAPSPVAPSVKLAARARYADEAAWSMVARPLQDQIRERKRAALVDRLTTSWGWKVEDLYAHYLIDPEMSACMLTSRIKQAISSVQLFVQRIFLRLEGSADGEELSFRSEDAAEQWEWMKNYRVWEANRKVFLFPENWIEPELRDDKSPFFKELESELRQSELTAESVERAYLNDLNRLETVSHLEIVAQCYSHSHARLHVFGRTRARPHTYYHRLRDEGLIWSPWQSLSVETEGDHLVPIVRDDRLILCWPVFQEATHPASEVCYWTIRLAWIEYKDGTWGPQNETKSTLTPKKPLFCPYHCGWSTITIVRSDEATLLAPDQAADNRGLFSFEYHAAGSCKALPDHCAGLEVSYPEFDTRPSVADPYENRSLSVGWFPLFPNGAFTTMSSSRMMPRLNALWEADWPMCSQSLVGRGDPYYRSVLNGSVTHYPRLWHRLEGKDDFRIVPESQYSVKDLNLANARYLFVSDTLRTFHIDVSGNFARRIRSFYHPILEELIAATRSGGVPSLLATDHAHPLYRQQVVRKLFDHEGPLQSSLFRPEALSYDGPKPWLLKPREDITFEESEAYSLYNWELFFHIPLLIATRLSREQRFEEALRWFHYIFDPLTPDPDDDYDWQRPWKMGRFFDNGDARTGIEELLTLLSGGGLNENAEARRARVTAEIRRWRADPFKPHLLARMRITPYMKTVVMKYLDNLLAWGEQLFRRDTIESINEATQLYILAAEILGQRPETLPERQHREASYAGIQGPLDEFSNALEDEIPEPPHARSFVDTASAAGDGVIVGGPADRASGIMVGAGSGSMLAADGIGAGLKPGGSVTQGWAPWQPMPSRAGASIRSPTPGWAGPEGVTAVADGAPGWVDGAGPSLKAPPVNLPPAGLFFCIPQNEQLVGYWDKVADRLFKIRHCMNIEGVVRALPLFEPPIDPALLVKAAAAGVDFSTVLNDLATPTPFYRFATLAQKASELCQEVKSLGATLLAAVEKRDAEGLAILRSEQEIRLLELIRAIRRSQRDEATDTQSSLERAKAVADERLAHYETRIKTGLLEEEKTELKKREDAKKEEDEAAEADASARSWSYAPNVSIGYSFPGVSVSTQVGGMYSVLWWQNSGAEHRALALALLRDAELAAMRSGHKRREEDWTLQVLIAKGESRQIEKQVSAAKIRVEIAEQELMNHETQIESAKAVDEYFRSKFTNEDLYDWTVGQISAVYFQSYQLAYDMAKRAERAYRFELGVEDSDFIRFGYWDGLCKGLTAGEGLYLDLKRMEAAYLDKNRRDYEITRHISLRLHDPLSLMQLKETGACEVTLPEALFDADYPGHYFRRIKTLSLSIPCVVGPYTSINCTLTLLSSRVRVKPDAGAGDASGYRERVDDEDRRFRYHYGTIESIATSHGKGDSGLFELNFRDERFLPFEGAGAISTWRIELPKETNAFDLDTVSDLVLTLRYTAREGGAALRKGALAARNALLDGNDGMQPPPQRLFSIRHEFPDQWASFVTELAVDPATVRLFITPEHFSYLFRGRPIALQKAELYALLDATTDPESPLLEIRMEDAEESLPWANPFPSVPTVKSVTLSLAEGCPVPANIAFQVSTTTDVTALRDLVLMVTYTVAEPQTN